MAKPRSHTAQGLGKFAKGQTAKARALLRDVAIYYADVDSYVETLAEELITSLNELDAQIDDAVAEGRGAA